MDAPDAMGGAEAILAMNTLVLEGTGQTYRLGQQPNPDADLPVCELTEGNRTLVIHRLKNDIHADGMLLVYVAPFAELERTVRAMQSTARTQ